VLKGVAVLLVFQSIGEVVAHFTRGVVPGPVLGMVLLLIFLVARKKIEPAIAQAADGLLANLSVFFIPAAVGVMLYASSLQQSVLAWTLAIILSTIAAITTTALCLRWLLGLAAAGVAKNADKNGGKAP
jgi:holin-like protein